MCLKLFYIQLTGDKSELFLQNASPTCDIPFTIDLSGLAKVLLDLCPQAGHPFRGPRPTAGAALAEGWHHIRPGAGAGSRAVVVRVFR